MTPRAAICLLVLGAAWLFVAWQVAVVVTVLTVARVLWLAERDYWRGVAECLDAPGADVVRGEVR